MILLDGGGAFSLITPDFGLFFWTVFIFLLLWFLLGKFAFRPIANALRDRESSIDEALQSAEKARLEMANLKSDNERILNEAKEERVRIIKESKEIGQKIVEEAKDKAKDEANKITNAATEDILNQKMAAILDVKNMIGGATVDMAEKLLKRELKDPKVQKDYIAAELDKIKLN